MSAEYKTAHATSDGYISRMSNKELVHPRYGTPTREIEVIIPLSRQEQAIVDVLTNNREQIEVSLRSGVAQIGFEAGEPEYRSIKLVNGALIIDTFLTDVRTAQADKAFGGLTKIMKEGKKPNIARAVLLPEEARLSGAEIMNIRKNSFPFDHTIEDAKGTIGIPLNEAHVYALREKDITPNLIGEIFGRESARHAIQEVRDHYNHHMNGALHGKFHLVAIDVTTPEHHIFLTGNVIVDEKISSVRHGQAKLLDAGRTQGVRQGELFAEENMAHTPTNTRLLAHVYKANRATTSKHASLPGK